MYPSMNNNGCMPPRTSFFGNYYNDNNHSKAPQEFYNTPSSSSFLLPSPICIPLEDEAVFCEFFQQQQFVSNEFNTIILEHEMPKMESTLEEYSNNNGLVVTNDGDDDHVEPENSSPTKRVYKGDRHSKINTARGPRDRRMRLSLDVAKKLFGLQDLLGFDKASKTVDWLLTKSESAILELLPDQNYCSFMGVSNNSSSTSECEVMSGTAYQFMVKTGDDQATTNNKAKSSCGSSKKQKEKVTRVRKCADFHHPLAKASRERARERARERTTEKRNNKHGDGQESKFMPCLDQAMDQHVNRLGSWSTFPENQHQSMDQVSSNFQFNQGFVCDNSSLLMTGNWTPSYVFNYLHSSGLPHEHQFNDLQINEKAWEGSSN
ncbi:hypothetical protein L1987_14022 [Smallanthus sonchifolius]|uniref:Uncharacterized protein n=1 Tax=Smallanthus sonchifolius TaxID=185202 RepID=A0ACB9JI53_9ASTR|nr:hypothetical protein L1987_14022 [Smallanthus sonchifolius]